MIKPQERGVRIEPLLRCPAQTLDDQAAIVCFAFVKASTPLGFAARTGIGPIVVLHEG